MAEAAGLLVAGEMSLQRGQRLQGPVAAPLGLLRVPQIQFAIEIAPDPRYQRRMALAGDDQRQGPHPGAAA